MASEPGSASCRSGDPGDSGKEIRASAAVGVEGAAGVPGDGWTVVTRKARASRLGDPSSTKTQRDYRIGDSSKRPGDKAFRKPSFPSGQRNPRNSLINTQASSGTLPTSWKNICFAPCHATDSERKLKYIPPKIFEGKKIASLDSHDTLQAQERWSNTITGYIMGKRPFYPHLKANVARQWKIKGTLDIYTRENGFFLFKLSNPEDCQHVLENGPWFFDGRLMILKPWNASSGRDRDLLNSIPTWIQLPGLNLQAWTQTSIEKIASIVGTPLLLDIKTANGTRMEFARCLVEIEAASEQPNIVTIELEDGYMFDQPIIYEWMPKKCENCISFDHSTSECNKPKKPDGQAQKSWQSIPAMVSVDQQNSPVNSPTQQPMEMDRYATEQAGQNTGFAEMISVDQQNSPVNSLTQQPMELDRIASEQAGQNTGFGILIDSMVNSPPNGCSKAPQKNDQRKDYGTGKEEAQRSNKGKKVIKDKQESKLLSKDSGMIAMETSIMVTPPSVCGNALITANQVTVQRATLREKLSPSGRPSALNKELLQSETPIELEDVLDHLDSEMDLDFSLRGSSTKILSNSNSPPQEEHPHTLLETSKPFPNWSFSSSDQENTPSFTVSNPNWSIEQIQLQHQKDLEELGPKRKEKRKQKPRPPYSRKNQQSDQASTATPTKSLEL